MTCSSHAFVWHAERAISVLLSQYTASMASGVTQVIHRCEEAQECGYLGKWEAFRVIQIDRFLLSKL